MRRAARGAAVLLLAALPPALAAATGPDGPADRYPRAGDSYLVVRDGAVLWARAPDAPHAPASLAKLMTALLVAEGSAPDAWLTVSARAAAATGARLGLRTGERVKVGDALAAALVASANDACLALAEHAAGTGAAFVERMNRRAAALGLARTRYADPCGHDRPGQVTTANDLAALTRAVLAVPLLRELVARPRVSLATAGGRRLEAETRNSLLGRVRGLDGVKTGTTEAAGRCVVARAEREGSEVLVVLLGAPDRWWTAAALVEAAFRER